VSERFGAAAARLSGMAARLLGWRPDEFWRATPAELEAAAGTALDRDDAAGAGDLQRMQEMFPDG
jgi:hypothetical protein